MDDDLTLRRRILERERSQFDPTSVDAEPTDPVRESWLRCAPRLAEDQAAAPLDEPETAPDRWEASPIRRAWPELVDELQHIAADGDLVAAVTDESGRILWSWGGRRMRNRAEQVNFGIGGRWDEPSAGTNAVALALITRQPSTVFAIEHWCAAVHEWVCYSAPVCDHTGRPLGVIDLSTTWDHANALGLPTVRALARVVEHQAPRTRPEDPGPGVGPGVGPGIGPGPGGGPRTLELRALGRGAAILDGIPLLLTRRQLEILTVLACVGEASLGELHALLHGDRPTSPTTTKVEISQLRRIMGNVIASRPYRLTVPTRCDLTSLLDHLDGGDLAEATALYQGQLLTPSEAPFIVERRHHCDVALRTALLRNGTTAQLLRFAALHTHDTEVLERAVAVAAPDDPLVATATARLTVALDDDLQDLL